jgi:hypothetical protein
MRLATLTVGLVMLLAHVPALGGVGLFDGTSEQDWVRSRTSVIIAKVEAVQPADREALGELKLTLLPQATIGGAFDCGANPKIVVDCWYGVGGNSAIGERPREGTLVLALVCMYESEEFYRVPNENCPLLPNKQPLCVIKGMGDPTVGETLARVQKARAVAKRKAAEAGAKR